jgi:hypothetical protein
MPGNPEAIATRMRKARASAQLMRRAGVSRNDAGQRLVRMYSLTDAELSSVLRSVWRGAR